METVGDVSVPEFSVWLGDPDLVNDPWATLEHIRSLGPVVYNDTIDSYVVTGYGALAQVLGDAANFTTERHMYRKNDVWGGQVMLLDDGELHDAIKAVWIPDFSRNAAQKLEALIAATVDARLSEFVGRLRDGEVVDAREVLVGGIPVSVVGQIMQLPEEDFPSIRRWSDEMAGMIGGMVDSSDRGAELVRAGRAGTAALNKYAGDLARERRGAPGDDIISKFVTSEVACTQMSERDINASIAHLIFSGHETTEHLMALTLVALAQHPEQRRAIAADRSLVKAAVEEVHRWQTPVNVKSRHVVTKGVVVDGVLVPDGAQIVGLQLAANRDPGRWEHPERFDVHRPYRAHLGFGFGKHICIGMNLARYELEIWLNRLLDEAPEFELSADLDFGTNFWVRGPREVLVRTSGPRG
jgi:cytochrome P450